ncbi:MAG: acyltransferase family protein [Bacteroidales bacterium]|nr:acyltransferase family protein [Bacteroidales bacterium]
MKNFINENFHKTKPKLANGKPRIEFIDLAKGVCIILVVVFHAGFAHKVPAMNAMRMPLYFILSGLFFKDYGGLVQLLHKKCNKILVPFFFFTFLYLIPGVFKYSPALVMSVFIDPIYAPQVVNYPIWFLLCLFIVNMIYFSVQKYFHSWASRSTVVLLFGIAGYLLGTNHIYIPFFLGTAFSALPYFYIGVILKKSPILYSGPASKSLNYIYIAILLLAIASVIYCCYAGTPLLTFRSNAYKGNIWSIYIVSISLVLGLLLICKQIKWLPIVSYLGRYSIIVLGLHGLYLEFCTVPLSYFTSHTFTDIEILAIVLILCWLSIPVFKRYFPSFTAQTDLIRLPERCSKSVTLSQH